MKVCAIVVTFNRIELLKLTLKKLQNQTFKLNKIIIVNNASTDDTKNYLSTLNEEIFEIHNLETNLGGAGGFNYGIKKAYQSESDFFWIMDDDTIAEEDSLEKLLTGLDGIKDQNVGFVASNVLFKDNKPCIMNMPLIDQYWNEYTAKGIVKIKTSSFVSLLIKREVVKELGLPIKEFFLWGDDAEYTLRITGNGFEGYLIGDSIVHHYMNENVGVNIVKASSDRVNRFFYEYRNSFYINKNLGFKKMIKYFLYVFTSIVRVLRSNVDNKILRVKIILKGMISGITFNPKTEFCD